MFKIARIIYTKSISDRNNLARAASVADIATKAASHINLV